MLTKFDIAPVIHTREAWCRVAHNKLTISLTRAWAMSDSIWRVATQIVHTACILYIMHFYSLRTLHIQCMLQFTTLYISEYFIHNLTAVTRQLLMKCSSVSVMTTFNCCYKSYLFSRNTVVIKHVCDYKLVYVQYRYSILWNSKRFSRRKKNFIIPLEKVNRMVDHEIPRTDAVVSFSYEGANSQRTVPTLPCSTDYCGRSNKTTVSYNSHSNRWCMKEVQKCLSEAKVSWSVFSFTFLFTLRHTLVSFRTKHKTHTVCTCE